MFGILLIFHDIKSCNYNNNRFTFHEYSGDRLVYRKTSDSERPQSDCQTIINFPVDGGKVATVSYVRIAVDQVIQSSYGHFRRFRQFYMVSFYRPPRSAGLLSFRVESANDKFPSSLKLSKPKFLSWSYIFTVTVIDKPQQIFSCLSHSMPNIEVSTEVVMASGYFSLLIKENPAMEFHFSFIASEKHWFDSSF